MQKHGNRFLDIFFNLFWMFYEISGPLSHVPTERSTIVDLLIKQRCHSCLEKK